MSHAADTARVFIALWPNPGVREQLRAWRDRFDWRKSASPVPTGKLHVTLHFLGNVARERLPELAQGLGVPFAPFVLEFGHPELWHGGVAVLAPDVAPAPLQALHAALSDALLRLSLTPEARPYRPHVTLARRAGAALAQIEGPAVAWQVDGYALMESEGGGGAYRVVQTYTATA
jgi:2'-5' RNA ligase